MLYETAALIGGYTIEDPGQIEREPRVSGTGSWHINPQVGMPFGEWASLSGSLVWDP